MSDAVLHCAGTQSYAASGIDVGAYFTTRMRSPSSVSFGLSQQYEKFLLRQSRKFQTGTLAG
jgi:hypothetical protein